MAENQPKIPETGNCIFAIHFDFEKSLEHILIGELLEVQRYLRGYRKATLLSETKREIGTFAKECFHPMANKMANVRIGLAEGLGSKKPLLFEAVQCFLESMYQSDNLCHRFIAARLWSEFWKTNAVYSRRLKSISDKEYINTFVDRVEELTLPFRFSIEQDIMTWQCDHPKYPLRYFDDAYYRNPCGILWASNLNNDEYGFSAVSLMPILMYGLKQLYDHHLYFQRCKLCNGLFLAKTANIPTYCGEACKREAMRLNKQRFDEKAKKIRYERAHKNSYMYWYNKVKKLEKNMPGSEKQAKVLEAFESFKTKNAKRKAALKAGRINEKEYTNWLYGQQAVIDGLMENK